MFKWIKNFFRGWDDPTTETQLESAYRYCKKYDEGKISEETFKILLGTLDRKE